MVPPPRFRLSSASDEINQMNTLNAKGFLNVDDLKRPINRGHCYICERDMAGQAQDRDHVPPKSSMPRWCRQNGPLILRTHVECNQKQSVADHDLKDLLEMARVMSFGAPIARAAFKRIRHHRVLAALDSPGYTQFEAPRFEPSVERMLRAFHSSLYGEPKIEGPLLSHQSKVFLPWPSEPPTDGGVVIDSEQAGIIERVRDAASANCVNWIRAWDGALLFAATWFHRPSVDFTHGQFGCHWVLQLFQWQQSALDAGLGSPCAGVYYTHQPPPHSAQMPSVAIATPLQRIHPQLDLRKAVDFSRSGPRLRPWDV